MNLQLQTVKYVERCQVKRGAHQSIKGQFTTKFLIFKGILENSLCCPNFPCVVPKFPVFPVWKNWTPNSLFSLGCGHPAGSWNWRSLWNILKKYTGHVISTVSQNFHPYDLKVLHYIFSLLCACNLEWVTLCVPMHMDYLLNASVTLHTQDLITHVQTGDCYLNHA